MKLSECKMGKLVALEKIDHFRVGMIVGITSSAHESFSEKLRAEIRYAVVLVKFSAEEEPRPVHPANLKPLEEYGY